MAYYEGDNFPAMGGYNNGGGFGDSGWWGIILIALLFGWGGNRGFGGFGGGYGSGGSEVLGYELGKAATTNDVASGFNNSAVLSSLNDIKLGQASMQNWINQGFSGLNVGILTAQNNLSAQLASCCCDTRAAIADLKYANERQTCEILNNANQNTQRILDYMQNEKINSLTAENVALKGRISNDAQTAAIVGALAPTARPAYIVPNPNCCYSTCGNGFGNGIYTVQ